MSINIKNREAEALIAELKRHTGKGTTDLFLDLLRRETERLRVDRQARLVKAREEDWNFQEEWARLPIVDPRPLDQIIEYDENGLPI